MTKTDRYMRMVVAAGLVAALACGSSGREPVDDSVSSGGSLVSEKAQIAFTHATKFNWSNWASSPLFTQVRGETLWKLRISPTAGHQEAAKRTHRHRFTAFGVTQYGG